MENLTKLNQKELTLINGGSFGYDIGWFLGNTIAGNFSTIGGISGALADYAVHYSTN